MGRKRRSKTPFFKTAPGFAAATAIAVGLVCAYFGLAWHAFDADSRDRFGIPDAVAHMILGSFAPVITANALVLRNAFLLGVGGAPEDDSAAAPIRGIGKIYAVAMLGIAVAGTSVIYASLGSSMSGAKVFIGVAASIWAGTVTYVLERFFKAGAA